ncbi:MAG: hypothetical protein Q4D98_01830 [Planctomycetia bacterium]|nr:hypothetical protein [Planctomycetia bacterium]
MKKMFVLVGCVVAGFVVGNLNAAEYGENDYTGTVPMEQAEAPAAPIAPDATPVSEGNESEDGVKCFFRYRWCGYYYYRPVYYYYRPVYYRWYRTYYYRYTYRYITFYKSADVKSATNDTGVLIEEAPLAGTPLAAHGVVKGDVITHINGQKITDPAQIDTIAADSKLVILKVNGGTNPVGATAPQAPEVEYEYGALEY